MTDTLSGTYRILTYYDGSYPPELFEPKPPDIDTDPHIDSLTPNTAVVGDAAVSVTVAGSNFEDTSIIEVGGATQTTTFVSATELTADFDPAAEGSFAFSVRNADDAESNDMPFTVTAAAELQAELAETEVEAPEAEPEPSDEPTDDEPAPVKATKKGGEEGMMAYATPEQLAQALDIRVTAENQQTLEDCLDAAATEIDHFLCNQPITNPPPTIVVRINVNRAVEWFKAPATYNGGVGYVDTGQLKAPASGFERHAAALLPLQHDWAIG